VSSSIIPTDKRPAGERGGDGGSARLYRLLLPLALVFVAATALGAYAGILNIGFLLDDFSHLDYAYRAWHGDWAPLLHTFTSNWTGTADNLTSYRPLISVSFVIDYFFWQFHAYGYHLTNLFMFAACSVLTSLIAYKLTAPYAQRTRTACALASGLLFALYPLHPEAVAWIIGRVDVQCGLFYLASLYCYLLWRGNDGKGLLIASLVAFSLALPAKEMAATLPAVITLAEVLLPGDQLGWTKRTVRKRATVVALFWGLLLVFAVLRTLAIGTLVGGYGGGGWKTFFRSLRNFVDRDTWCKVLYGLNEEMPARPELVKYAFTAWWTLVALAVARLGERAWYWRIIAFLLIFTMVSELPTYQIWHVFPNLSGSRLLFIPSAPACIALSMVALPVFNLLQQQNNRLVKFFPSVLGAATLIVLSQLWSAALQTNLLAWTIAGQSMDALIAQVRQIASHRDDGKVALLLDLPQDASGSGMLGRPEFLQLLLGPPLIPINLNSRIVTAERPIAGSHEFANPHMLQEMLKQPALHAAFLWRQKEKMYCNWTTPKGENSFVWNGDISAKDSEICWLPPVHLNPFAAEVVTLKYPGCAGEKAAIQLVWQSMNQPKSWIKYSEGPLAESVADELVMVPSRYRSWLFNGTIERIGFKLPRNWSQKNVEVKARSDRSLMPQLVLRRDGEAAGHSPDALRDRWQISLSQGAKIKADCDATEVSGARKAELLVTRAGVPFLDTATRAIPGKKELLATIALNGLSARVELPPEASMKPGVHQVAVAALDENDKVVGFLSEPCTYSVVSKK
jgi:hypothetical protein